MAPPPPPSLSSRVLRRSQTLLAVLGGLYAIFLGLLATPYIQNQVLYAHKISYPVMAEFNKPEKYGLAPGRTLNVHFPSADNTTLGAWFLFSDPFYHSLRTPSQPFPSFDAEEQLPATLKTHRTILMLHGNAAARAAPFRVRQYTAYSTRIGANVLAVDYRGFGDSEGEPFEEGVVSDARAAWDWLIARGARPEDVLIVGHSLGTGIGSQLAAQLVQEGIRPRGLALLAPFSSIYTLMDTYNIFGLIPVMKPVAFIPGAPNFLKKTLQNFFDTLSIIHEIKLPLLLVHAENDWDIPWSHSAVLFNALLSPLLPALPEVPHGPASWSSDDWSNYTAAQEKRSAVEKRIVQENEIHEFGYLRQFSRPTGDEVTFLRIYHGGHDPGNQEGVQDVMSVLFDM